MLIEEKLVKVIYKFFTKKEGETAARIANAGSSDEKQQYEYLLWGGMLSSAPDPFLLLFVAKIEGWLFPIFAKEDLKSIFCWPWPGVGGEISSEYVYWKFTRCLCSC